MSTEAISAGDRWNDVITDALDDIDFGLLFVTEENKEKPWLLFEAGALAKNVSRSKVIPIIIDASELELSRSPLFAFQHVGMTKDGVSRVMRSIYKSLERPIISNSVLTTCIDKWWPELDDAYKKLEKPKPAKAKKKLTEDERLDRIETSLSDVLNTVSRTIIKQPRSSTMDSVSYFVKHAQKLLNQSGPSAAFEFLKSTNDYSLLKKVEEQLHKQKTSGSNNILIEIARDASLEADIPF